MSRSRLHLVTPLAFAVLGLWSQRCYAQAWYEQEPAKCDMVAADVPTLEMINTIFPRQLPINGNPLRALYMEWSTADYRRIQNSPNHSALRREHTLTAADRNNLKQQFTKLATGGKVPWYVNAAASATSWLISDSLAKNIFKGVKTIFKGVLDEAGAKQMTAAQMAEVFAVGGVLREVMTADEPSAGKPYMSDAVIYQVKVGNEMRNYTILSCTYAVKLQ